MAELWQQTLNWQPDPKQSQQFEQLYQRILAGNQQFNLTRITNPVEFWEKHLWDSLKGIAPQFNLQDSPLQVIDIGTGAGFPGVPVAIVHPAWKVTLLDSTRKKMAFVQTLVTDLGIENASTLSDRAEQVGKHSQYRATFDLALIRAVAAAPVCAEYALPLLKPGGLAILYRGQWLESEAEALQPVMAQLGGEVEAIEAFSTPISQSVRHCLYLRKIAPSPQQFPRPIGMPVHNPLASNPQ
ncbi:MAG: 16S rRNA (guanine(527)-N(7))-methyltransferase RsmG, partial [Leptolyngbyaceae bacterium]|nr:16S rRNA (guanine(527)-N(7))-methyltransferase RsmG [Leptolyngbyaceae bacterium]